MAKNKFNNQTFSYIFDSGHGWLAVPKRFIPFLNMSVSSCSYIDSRYVYLEEDLDMQNFDSAMKSRGLTYNIIQVNSGESSFIRNKRHVT